MISAADDVELGDAKGRVISGQQHRVDLEWRGVSYSVRVKNQTTKSMEDKHILSGLSGWVPSGNLCAILGPSGAGKTSLLNVLADRVPLTKGAQLRGSVALNGMRRGDSAVSAMQADVAPAPTLTSKKAANYNMAYCMQSDALFDLSTVFETFYFSARLGLPELTEQARLDRIRSLIADLGLVNCRDTIVGNEHNRGLSGGERKRVCIGVELMRDPPLIFVDEPTSGLDSFQAQSVMEAFETLTRLRGRTIVVSIHQPRSSIYAKFDKIIVLSAGQTVFSGARSEADAHFAAQGVPVPHNFNPADWFLDAVSVDFRTDASKDRTKAVLRRLHTAWSDDEKMDAGRAATVLAKTETSAFDDGSALPPSVGGALQDRDSGGPDKKAHSSNASGGQAAPQRVGALGALPMLLKRTWREFTRDIFTLTIKFCFGAFFSILFGVVYLQLGTNQQSLQDRTGILFFLCMNQAFGSVIGISKAFPQQLRVVKRERASGLYPLSAFYVATFLVQLPFELIPQCLFATLTYWMVGLRSSATHYLIFLGIMMLQNLVGIGLGMCLSSCFKKVTMAAEIAPAVVVLFLVFSGYFLNESSVPVWLSWVKHASFIRYSFQAVVVNEFAGRSFSCGEGDEGCVDGDGWIDKLNFEDVLIGENVGILAAMYFGFCILAYALLLWSSPVFLKFGSSK